jgi:hypothetical protein
MTSILDNLLSEYLSEEPCEGKLHAGFCEGSQVIDSNVKHNFNERKLS